MMLRADVCISKHAMERYQARVNSGATYEEILWRVQQAKPVKKRLLRYIRDHSKLHRQHVSLKSEYRYLIHEDVVFVAHRTEAGHLLIVTAWRHFGIA